MSWRDIINAWMDNEVLDIMELVQEMERNQIIPAGILRNTTLHCIILTHFMLEELKLLDVPRAPQGNNFSYHMNAKEILQHDLVMKTGQLLKRLEEETGVNLEHYHKIENVQKLKK